MLKKICYLFITCRYCFPGTLVSVLYRGHSKDSADLWGSAAQPSIPLTRCTFYCQRNRSKKGKHELSRPCKDGIFIRLNRRRLSFRCVWWTQRPLNVAGLEKGWPLGHKGSMVTELHNAAAAIRPKIGVGMSIDGSYFSVIMARLTCRRDALSNSSLETLVRWPTADSKYWWLIRSAGIDHSTCILHTLNINIALLYANQEDLLNSHYSQR